MVKATRKHKQSGKAQTWREPRNPESQVDSAIALAERIAAGKARLSTVRKIQPITAMMILLWFHHRMPEALRHLDDDIHEALWERIDWRQE